MHDPGIWLSIAVRLVALILYSHHFLIVASQYRKERTRRMHRYMVISLVVLVGVSALTLGGFVLVWPDLRDAARTVGVLAGGAVFVGAIYLEISHRLYP